MTEADLEFLKPDKPKKMPMTANWVIISIRLLLIAFILAICVLIMFIPASLYYETQAYRAKRISEAETIMTIERAKAELEATKILASGAEYEEN